MIDTILFKYTKNIFLLIVIINTIACSSEITKRPMLGEWASINKDNSYLLIYEDNSDIIVKCDFDSRKDGNEKIYTGTEQSASSILINDNTQIKYLSQEERIIFNGDTFVKVRELSDVNYRQFKVGPQIENIRKIYRNTTNLAFGERKIKRGCLEYISYGKEVKMVSRVMSSDHSYSKSEYYFDNNRLVFFYGQSVTSQGHFSNTSTKQETRIYYSQGKVLKFKQDNQFEPNEKARIYVEDADELVSYFTKVDKSPDICELL